MITPQQIHGPTRSSEMRQWPSHGRLDDHIIRALNKIKKPSTSEQITELLNGDLGPDDRPFQTREVDAWLRNAGARILNLFWLGSRPRR
jgi:hypothetical protein